jgi:periplasmic divalent cation tolerance protein
MLHEISILLTSVGKRDDAETLAKGLVDENLAACVQISEKGISYYRWEGIVQRDQEYYLSIKTSRDKLAQVAKWLEDHHPYEIPEIVCITAMARRSYANWMQTVLAEDS